MKSVVSFSAFVKVGHFTQTCALWKLCRNFIKHIYILMYPKHLKEILFALFSSLPAPRCSHIDKKSSAVFMVLVSTGQICAVIN